MWWVLTSPQRMVCDSDGSITNSRTSGFALRKAWPTTIRVPPVPMPMTSASGTRSPNCARISGPRISRFSSTLYSDSNWAGAKYPGCSPSRFASSSAELTWKWPTKRTSAPYAREIATRSFDSPSGITTSIR